MHKEQITKQFLIDICKEELPEKTGFTIVSTFLLKTTPVSRYSSEFSKNEVVEPEDFISHLGEMAYEKDNKGQIESVLKKIALKILFIIECDLIEVPKYINDPHIKSFAKWRLKNGI